VEQAVLSHPAVEQCAVVGAPDEKWGEVVTAVVQLKAGATLDPDELIARCKQALGSVKAPKRVEIWDELPRSGVGKILKRDVRATFWAGRARAI
jgi:acyl-CoA synthetase (AMP-forming)/AMP-acid ligase II